MKKKLIVVYLLIILLPLALITWFGMRSVKDEQERNQRNLEEALSARLADTDKRLIDLLKEMEADFLRMEAVYSLPIDEIRRLTSRSPLIRQFFLLDQEGAIFYPAPGEGLSQREQDFHSRTKNLSISAALFHGSAENTPQSALSSGSGWYTWFWADGINFIFWLAAKSGGIIGIEVERTALIAAIVSVLPDSDIAGSGKTEERIVLSDVKGATIYQWGTYRPEEEERPIVSIPLSAPLSMWSLSYFAAQKQSTGNILTSGYFSLASGIFVLVVALAGLSVYFHRENSREIREALRKVSFVNQVSHELKTPLTNIRMYAELLAGEIPADWKKASNYLGIVISESRRLSRLIGNVLTFARKEKKNLSIHAKPGVADEVIANILENFKPALTSKGFVVDFIPGGAQEEVLFDADILEQIVNNLISNVEKYAAAGKYLKVETELNHVQDRQKIVIRVADRGPGIPARERKRIFLPFTRLKNRLTEGISGTGIGLTIARELAILHGGSLELLPSERGAVLQLIISVGDNKK